jgi:iron(III) transport system permease protein
MAMVETVVLAAVCLLFLVLLRWFERGREYAAVGKGTAAARKPVDSPAMRWLVTVGSSAAVVFLLLPHLTLLLVSFVPDGAWTTTILPTRYSLENYRALAAIRNCGSRWPTRSGWPPWPRRPTWWSASWRRTSSCGRVFPGRGLLGLLVILPYALPGTVVAIALSTTFSTNEPLAARFVLVGTYWILILAYFVRNLPLVAQPAIAAFRQFDPVLEEASYSLGAGWGTTMRRVAAPLVLPGLAAGGSLAFVTALGEFVASILLYTHRTRPISMEILAQLRAFDFGAAAAMGVLLALLMAVVFMVGGRFIRGTEAPRG